MNESSSQNPEYGSEGFRKKFEDIAKSAMNDDTELVNQVIQALSSVVRLIPSIGRIREIANDASHPIFASPNSSPLLKEHMRQMRRAQLGSLIQTIRVIQKTQNATFTAVPDIERKEKKNIVDEALRNLGINDV